jgi:beta-lactamase class A
VVAHKTGTGGSQNGIAAATNDIGIIYLPNGNHLGVAVFVSDSAADERTREAVISKIAKAAWDHWSK